MILNVQCVKYFERNFIIKNHILTVGFIGLGTSVSAAILTPIPLHCPIID